jgi:membrane-bound serine protease (ClpP class)
MSPLANGVEIGSQRPGLQWRGYHRGMKASPACRVFVVGLLLLAAPPAPSPPQAQSSDPVVYVIPIEGMIDLGLAPFLSRTVREAHAAGAAAVLLDINTFGGRVDAAVAMRDTLINSPVRTIAFVNQRAISAGALIALLATPWSW